MQFWTQILKIMNLQMETPSSYGLFHILWLVITAEATVLLCLRGRDKSRTVCNIVLGTALAVMAALQDVLF